jgi:hypothetical protein
MAKQRKVAADDSPSALRHVLVVGGTTAEWDALGPDLWAARRNELAKVVAHAGAMWLTLRPYCAQRPGEPAPVVGQWRTERVVDVREGCTVIVDPTPDGRARLLAAIDQLRELPPDAVDEAAIAAVLMAPAPIEPDLTVVLGSIQHLPPSLVWELAYSEIVFIDTVWNELAAAHVEHAIEAYSRRHRRFGGIE